MKQLFKKENPIGYCLFPVLVFLVGKQLVYELLMTIAQEVFPFLQEGVGILVNGLADVVMIPVMWKWFLSGQSGGFIHAVLPEGACQRTGQSDRPFLQYPAAGVRQILMLCLLGVSVCLAGNGLIQLTGLTSLFAGDYSNTMETLYGGTLWLQIFWMVIAAPVAEELVYRRILYGRIREYCDVFRAAAGASLLFGVTHGFVLQGTYSFLLGMVLCFLMERYRAMYPSVVVHMAANFCSVAVTFCIPVQNWLSDRRHFAITALLSVIVCILITGYLVKTAQKSDMQDQESITNKNSKV